MKKTLMAALTVVFIAGCGQSLEGVYELDIQMPNLSGLPFAPAQKAQLNQVFESQKSVLEFEPGRKVTFKANGIGTETKYTIKGKLLRIELPDNTFMELKIEGDSLIGPMGMRFVKK